MDVKDFDYELPEELIAQDPLTDRSSSRLMLLDKDTGAIEHRHFRDIIDYLEPGDCLVINDTKVIPARLLGVKEDTGAHAEILLLTRKTDNVWECLVRPGKKLREGARVVFGNGELRAEILGTVNEGNRLVRFEYQGIFEEVLDRLGEMPLPPYIKHKLEDKDRYQTVYAKNEGSAAAPTAGLHFTNELLSEIEDKGINIARVTLHVGLGTFRPVKADKIEDHHMHSEFYIVNEETVELINRTMESGHKIISVGTTSTRTLESAAVLNPEFERLSSEGARVENAGTSLGKEGKDGSMDISRIEDQVNKKKYIIGADGRIIPKYILKAQSAWTSIFIYPGYEWKLVDELITNFHLPQSTLIMLVSSLCGRTNILNAYKEAVRERYRFFSFGDAMFLHD
ncbi:MAG TPA: tRNA preQ1(34) S-adenosylmethionine ribosyltransferase-isomerase QueA [Candidatus Avilachnospira avicola]|nr:tRNA preQ1(34) S-adenosylmethionine ribosyltransferase-isomerase QueA [Candidatus Avilachnospira avicola]